MSSGGGCWASSCVRSSPTTRASRVDLEPFEFGSGAGLVVDDAAWVIVDGPAGRTLGASLVWAIRRQATSLDIVAEREGGQLARRAMGFDFPIRVGSPRNAPSSRWSRSRCRRFPRPPWSTSI